MLRKIKKHIKKYINRNGIPYRLWLRYVYKIRPHSMAVIETTDRCNLACSYCPKSKGIGLGSEVISHDTFVKIYDNLIQGVDLKFVSLVGFGEPLINKELYKAVQYIKSKTPKAEINVTTNGILYTPKLAQLLSDSGLTQIIISLNLANKEIYKKYNMDDYFDTIWENLVGISKIKKNIKTHIIVQLLDLQENQPYLKQIQADLESFGFEFQLKPFLNWGGEFDASEENNKSQVTERYPCANIEQYLWVHLNGNVQVCCSALPKENSQLIIGNIFESTAEQILHGKKYLHLKKLNCTNCLSSISECSECNAWAETPNIYFKYRGKWY